MNIKLAAAMHTPSGQMVDVLAVRNGTWTVRDQWNHKDAFEVPVTDLDMIWPNTDILDTIDELYQARFEIVDMFHMLCVISHTPEWAALLLMKWAELY